MKPTYYASPGSEYEKQAYQHSAKLKWQTQRLASRSLWLLFAALLLTFLPVMVVQAGGTITNGYIPAVLRSGCADSPTPPPPVGETRIGTNYVIMTIADANPFNFTNAQQLATDAIFESLMPLYCALPATTNNCVTNYVQWGIITYDANGHPVSSGCAASGCQFHSDTGTPIPNRIPRLTVSSAATNTFLSWPTMESDFVLEESTNLINWYPVTWPTTTNFATIVAQFPRQGPNHFFRLQHK